MQITQTMRFGGFSETENRQIGQSAKAQVDYIPVDSIDETAIGLVFSLTPDIPGLVATENGPIPRSRMLAAGSDDFGEAKLQGNKLLETVEISGDLLPEMTQLKLGQAAQTKDGTPQLIMDAAGSTERSASLKDWVAEMPLMPQLQPATATQLSTAASQPGHGSLPMVASSTSDIGTGPKPRHNADALQDSVQTSQPQTQPTEGRHPKATINPELSALPNSIGAAPPPPAPQPVTVSSISEPIHPVVAEQPQSARLLHSGEPANVTPPAPAQTNEAPQDHLARAQASTAAASDPAKPTLSTEGFVAQKSPVDDAQTQRNNGPAAKAPSVPPKSANAPLQVATEATGGQTFNVESDIQQVVSERDDAPSDMTAPLAREAGHLTQPTRLTQEVPRIISAQLVEVARSHPDKPVELTLNPEELGRLRMTFQTEASSMNVILQFERPETLDLMRRHIELLAQDMHELGYDNVNFSFQQQGDAPTDGHPKSDAEPSQSSQVDTIAHTPKQDVVKITIGESVGMDIRI